MSKNVVIFIHGLGADDKNWWGATEDSLRKNPELITEYDIRFFHYKTDKIKTIINDAKNNIGLGEVQASLKDLGLQLTEYIESHCKDHTNIKLFGHSMGGLVISASLPELQKHFPDIYTKISSIAFAGTPLGGSSVSTILKKFFGFIVSKQTKDLSLDSQQLQSITAPLSNYLTIDPLKHNSIKKLLIFFRIGEDEVVSDDNERYGNFEEDIQNIDPRQYYLIGKHSESVQNLSGNHKNFENIMDWITQYKNSKNSTISTDNISSKKTPSFDSDKEASCQKVETNYYERKTNRNYIVLERYISKTYLQNQLIIQDVNQKIKVMDTRECIIEFYHGFYKDVKHLANEKYLNKLKKNLIKRNKKLTGTAYKTNKKIKINRFKYPIFLGQKTINNSTSNIETDTIDFIIKEKSMGLNFKFGLGEHPIDTIIDIKFSFTLPTDIYYTKQPDSFKFKTSAAFTKIVIQEEIYGNSSYKFEVRWKRNNKPCTMNKPKTNLYYIQHHGNFLYEDMEDIYEIIVERK